MSFKVKDGLVVGSNTVIDGSGNFNIPGKLTTSNTTSAAASLNLGTGTVDPSAPLAGDFWYTSGSLKVRNGSSQTKTIAYTDSTITGNANNVTGTVAIANGGTGATTDSGARTNLGATTVGSNLFTLTNPSAIRFIRINADNSVTALSDVDFRTAIGAGTSSTTGTVTSIATGNGITGGTITGSGTLGLTGQALALHNLATNGFFVRTGANTVAARNIAVASNVGLSITNEDGVSGNPTISTNATSSNTQSTLVIRDSSGNFSAGTITANLTGNASTASQVVATATGTNSTNLVVGNMADTDRFRVLVGGTATDAGFAEIATTGDANEPIHVRQYTGDFATLSRTFTLLDASGNSIAPGTLSANALTATNAVTGGSVVAPTITGSTSASGTLSISSTTNATKGTVNVGDDNAGTATLRGSALNIKLGTAPSAGFLRVAASTGAVSVDTASYLNTATTQSGSTVYAGPLQLTAAVTATAPTFRTLEMTDIPGAALKKSVRVATTAALTLNAATTSIDGVTISATDRVLIKDQATPSQNGIYYDVTTTLWKRTFDADSSAELAAAIVVVDEGTANGGKTFTNRFKLTDTVGTTAMPWYEVYDSGTIIPATNGGTGINNGTRTLTISGQSFTLSGSVGARTITTASDITVSGATTNGRLLTIATGDANRTLTLNADLTVSNSLTLAGTNATTMTFPAASTTVAGLGTTQTFTGINTFSPTARTSGTASYFTITTPADTGITASTESIGTRFTAATRTWATGALTLQRERVFEAPTYAFAAASTLTDAVNVDIADPVAGTNATITNRWALRTGNLKVNGLLDVSSTSDTATAASHYYVETGTDGKVRPKTLANVQAEILGGATLTSSTLSMAGAGNVAIELGRIDGSASTPFIDFHSGATSVDYDSRIIASGGNGTLGQGTLDVIAAAVEFTGNVVPNTDNTGNVGTSALTWANGQFTNFTVDTALTVGGTVSVPAGTAAAPSIRFSDDTNTGIYRSATDALSIATNGTERLRIDSAGNLLVGTATALDRLTVAGNATFNGNGTARQTAYFANTGGQLYIGTESSAGNGVFTGGTAYAGIIGTNNATPLQFSTNGAMRATIDSSGNLGLGVTPSAWLSNWRALDILGAGFASGGNVDARMYSNAYFDGGAHRYKYTGAAASYVQSSSSHAWNIAPSGTAGNAITFTTAMTLDASSNLTVTGNVTGNNLVYTSGDQTIGGNKTFSGTTTLTGAAVRIFASGDLDTTGNAYLTFQDNSTGSYVERGWVGYGSSNGNFTISNGVSGKTIALNAAGGTFTLDGSGNVVASGNVTAFSDARLKTDLKQIDNALNKVQQLTGYTYTRIDTKERQTGIIAQDLQKVLPEAVIDKGEYLSVAYGNLVGLLIEAIKELKLEIEELKRN